MWAAENRRLMLPIGNKMQKKIRKIAALFSSCFLSLQYALTSFAIDNASIDDEKFKSMTATEVPSLIIGTVIWGLRIIGAVVIMTGVYKMAAARKSGEADDINGAMIKLVVGFCFVSFASILKALNILN